MTDHEILQFIRERKLEKPVKELYKSFPVVRLTLLKYGATEIQVPEIFNDSLVILIEKASESEFQLTSKLSTYLVGISLNRLRNLLRKENRSEQFVQFSSELFENSFNLPDDNDNGKEEKLMIVDSILDTIQERCKQLLKLFYFEKKSMQEISEIMNFSSMQSAKTQKYKCLEKAHQMANELIVESKNTVL